MCSGISRRKLVRLISVWVGGSAAVGSIQFMGELFGSNAQAREEVTEQIYKGRKYKLKTKAVDDTHQKIHNGAQIIEPPYDAPVELYVDDKKVEMIRAQKTGKYKTYLLPFNIYNSPQDVAKDLIDMGVQVP